MKTLINLTSKDAVKPRFATKGAAGADLVGTRIISIYSNGGEVKDMQAQIEKAEFDRILYLKPFAKACVGTGVKIALPDGFEAQIRPKSGNSLKTNIDVKLGTIDSDYRGELGIIIQNVSMFTITVPLDVALAQLVISKVEQTEFEEIEVLNKTTRNEGGFGSTGNNAISSPAAPIEEPVVPTESSDSVAKAAGEEIDVNKSIEDIKAAITTEEPVKATKKSKKK